jgi:hypothetical protein
VLHSNQLFVDSGLGTISIEDENAHLKIVGHFIFNEIFGFRRWYSASLPDLRFEPGSTLSCILDLALSRVELIKSIVILASVTTIAGCVFAFSVNSSWISAEDH